jgi:prevent-host-death family protein
MAEPAKSDFSDNLGNVERMTATEVARAFSQVLNRVAAGEQIEVTRNGTTVAVIGPPPKKKRFLSTEEFQELVDSLPPLDEDFVRDLEQIRRESGFPRDPWES